MEQQQQEEAQEEQTTREGPPPAGAARPPQPLLPPPPSCSSSIQIDNEADQQAHENSKPARRRRRLAHRRQYAKSRRLNSSYLRSQFVRYDSGQADGEQEADGQPPGGLDDSAAAAGDQRARQRRSESNDDWTSADDQPRGLPIDVEELRLVGGLGGLGGLGATNGDYSSSSLDSYSPGDHRQHAHPPAASWRDSALNRLKSPLAATAKSLVSLTNVGGSGDSCEGAAQTTASQHQQHHQQQQQPAQQERHKLLASKAPNLCHKKAPAIEEEEQPNSGDCLVRRSETVDLNKIRQQKSQQQRANNATKSSNRFRFFPSNEIINTPNTNNSSCEFSSSEQVSQSAATTTSCQQQQQQQQHANSARVPLAKTKTSHKEHDCQSSSVDQIATLRRQQVCIDNVHFNDIFQGATTDSSTSVTINQSVRADPRLHMDDVDIKFSRALNSCKLPQIRYASKERLFERLTDLRFLSIDFLNTFLLTYRVFTTAKDVLEALKSVHYNSERYFDQQHKQTVAAAGGQAKRDSFCAGPGGSMTSLLGQPAPGSSPMASPKMPSQVQQQQQQQQQRRASLMIPANQQTDSQGAHQHAPASSSSSPHRQPPPVVPPRSPGLQQQQQQQQQASNLLNQSVSSVDTENNFLLATPQQPNQKRRSTISALTQITGSSNSSLVNLAKSSAERITGQQVATSAREDNSQQASCRPAAAAAATSPGGRQSTGPPPRQATIAANLSPSGARINEEAANRLAVPTGRQVRANSLTSVASVELPTREQSLSSSSIKSCAAAVGSVVCGPTGSATNEHWRLSYKKSSSGAGGQQAFGKPKTCNFLTAGNFLTASIRRKSAADADMIRLQITPAPLDQQQQQQQQQVAKSGASDEEDDEDERSSRSHLLLFNYPPNVPPSTPIPPTGGSSTSSLIQAASDRVLQGQSTPPRQQAPKNHKRHRRRRSKSERKLTTQVTSSSSYSSSSSSSSQVSSSDERPDKSHSHRNARKNRSSQTNSVSTSQSESGLIQSTSSSSSRPTSPITPINGQNKLKPKPKPTKPTQDASKLMNGLESPKQTARADKRGLKTGAPVGSIQRADSKQRRQSESHVILKEIDLTTRAKLLDFDTSADDSDAQTSDSSSAAQSADDDHHHHHHAGQHSAHTNERQEDKLSFSMSNVRLADEQPATASKLAPNVRPPTATRAPEDRQQAGADRATSTAHSPPSQRPTSSAATTTTATATAATTTTTTTSTSTVRPMTSNSCLSTPRSSFQHTAAESLLSSKAGVVVTSKSPRVSSRRSSTASAASAFAAATAASCNPLLTQPRNNSTSGHLLQQQAHPDQLANCSCAQLHRGSISSIQLHQQRQRNHLIDQFGLSRAGQLQFTGGGHHPSCIHFHTVLSDNSSNNSRANSRLSSCAGLEFNSVSSTTGGASTAGALNQAAQRQSTGAASTRGGQPAAAPTAPAPQAQATRQQQQQQQQMASANSCGRISSSASTSCNQSKRNSQVLQLHQQQQLQLAQQQQQSNVRSMATLRVLSVLRHWVSKHSQDFVNDTKLSYLAQEFLQDLIMDSSLLPAEHKAAIQLQQMIQKAAHMRDNQTDLDTLLAAPPRASPDTIETLSALEIAETMTYLDHKIFLAIKSEEFLGQAWMKADKALKAPHILLITKRFNDVSRLVSSEIIRVPELHRRVLIIEKWTNVAHICRVIHNFNGVLQICAAFTNSAVFRLKKTWDKIPKTTKATIDQLQNLVSTDSRFRNMRDAINRCDPPSIPYVGMYLTDLSFIEEGTPNYSPEGLLNFSKMRMIAHVIREIQHLQNGVYKLNFNTRVANYLLDASRHLQDDEMYKCSLAIEPRSSGTKNGVQLMNNVNNNNNNNNSSQQQAANII